MAVMTAEVSRALAAFVTDMGLGQDAARALADQYATTQSAADLPDWLTEPRDDAVQAAADAQGTPDYEAIQQAYEDARDDLQRQWPDLTADVVAALALAAALAVAGGALALLGSLTFKATLAAPVVAAVAAGMTGLAVVAAGQAAAEVAALGQSITPNDVDTDRIAALAEAFTGQILAGYAGAAGRKALQLAAPGATRDSVAAAVRAHLDTISTAEKGMVVDGLGAALSTAQWAGRLDVFAQFPDAIYRAEEVNDQSRCSRCSEIDQAEFQGLAAALEAYPLGGGFRACQGGIRCRGTFHLTAF